jgi:hypothetical protein
MLIATLGMYVDIKMIERTPSIIHRFTPTIRISLPARKKYLRAGGDHSSSHFLIAYSEFVTQITQCNQLDVECCDRILRFILRVIHMIDPYYDATKHDLKH